MTENEPERLTLEEQDSVDMTVDAEIKRLKEEGVETQGEKVALVYTICENPRLSDEAKNNTLSAVLGLDTEQIEQVFSSGIPQRLERRLDATAAYASILIRETGADYSKIDSILTTPVDSLRKAPYSRFSPPRSPLKCMKEGEIYLVLSVAVRKQELI